MTLLAATVAWFAVKRQIASAEEIANRGQEQAMRAIENELKPLLDVLDVFWLTLDETEDFQGSTEEKLSRTTWLQSTIFKLPPPTIIEDLEKIAPHLSKDKERELEKPPLYLKVFYRLVTAYSERATERSDELKWRLHELRLMRIQLAHVKNAVVAFEPDWATSFTAHKVVAVDATTYADMLRSDRAMWLEEEAHRRAVKNPPAAVQP
jgi:hypothetical protein